MSNFKADNQNSLKGLFKAKLLTWLVGSEVVCKEIGQSKYSTIFHAEISIQTTINHRIISRLNFFLFDFIWKGVKGTGSFYLLAKCLCAENNLTMFWSFWNLKFFFGIDIMKSKGHDLMLNLFIEKNGKRSFLDNILNFYLKKTEWKSDKYWKRS